jgi:hypothetical protein
MKKILLIILLISLTLITIKIINTNKEDNSVCPVIITEEQPCN